MEKSAANLTVINSIIHKGYYKNKIQKIYQIGSRVYKCFEKTSDYDYLVVYESKDNIDEVFGEDDINIHLISESNFQKNIEKHLPFYLLTKWLPEENILLSNKKDKKFLIDYNLVYKYFIAEKDLCINKSMRYFNSNLRTSLKNIIHAIRYSLFGIQILEKGFIYDYTCANDYYNEIFKLNFDSWEKYIEYFKIVFEKIEKKFELMKNEFDEVISKFNKKPKQGLILTQFLKEFKIEDLEKYFCIEVTKKQNKIILELSKTSNISLKLVKECNPIILNEKLEILGIGLQNFFDSTIEDEIPKISKEKQTLISISGDFSRSIIFHDGNDWIEYLDDNFQKLNEEKQKKYQNISTSFSFNFIEQHYPKLFSVVDRYSFKDLNPKKFSDHFIIASRDYEDDQLGIYYDTESYIDEKFILIDDDFNHIFFKHPMIKIFKTKDEEKYLDLIRKSDLTSGLSLEYKTYLRNLSKDKLTFYNKLEEKYQKLVNNIFNSCEFDRDPFYEKAYESCEIDEAGLIEWLGEIDLKDFLKLLNHKRERCKIDKIWGEIKMYDIIPTEILILIFQYVDGSTMKLISYATSRHFNWIRSNEHLVNTVFQSKLQFYSKQMFDSIVPFKDTKQFQIYSRMLPYKLSNYSPTFNIYDNLYLISPRELNDYEKLNFKIYQNETPKAKSIVSFEKFLMNFKEHFHYDIWKDFINWDCFQVIGGSVLKCLLEDSFEDPNQDIDIFCTFPDFYEYDRFIEPFNTGMRKYGAEEQHTNGYEDSVRTVKVKIKKKELKFQFVLNEMEYYNLDMDCCQIGFNGKQVMVTHSFIQSINTGTMMNYHLRDSMTTKSINRIEKYRKRGFSFLCPDQYDYYDMTLSKEEEEEEDDEEEDFEYNNDSLEISSKMKDIIQQKVK
eukprot:gene7072-11235_t